MRLIRAYSYLRFSSAEQMHGDSARRQTALAEAYASEFGYDLDRELTFQDLGVSGHRGQNVRFGKLGDFLGAIGIGRVERGSVLLVENLDRISRDHALKAQNLLTQIVLAGVTVVTLSDRRVYSQAELERDPMGLIYALLSFIRANEESEIKAQRSRANWEAKRSRLGEAKLTAKGPAWVSLDRATQTFVPIQARVAVVRRMFEMALAGLKPRQIAAALNGEGTPAWNSVGRWLPASIQNYLEQPSVLGTFTPHRLRFSDSRSRRVPFSPVPNYYPAVVPLADFAAVQAITAGRNNGANASRHYLLHNLACCALCGSAMARLRLGKENGSQLVCGKARLGMGCEYREVPLLALELRLIKSLPDLLIDQQGRRLGKHLDRRLGEALERRARVDPSIASPGELEQYDADINFALEQRDIATRPKLAFAIGAVVEELRDGKLSPGARTRINTGLRSIFRSAQIGPAESLTLEWRTGGEVAV